MVGGSQALCVCLGIGTDCIGVQWEALAWRTATWVPAQASSALTIYLPLVRSLAFLDGNLPTALRMNG